MRRAILKKGDKTTAGGTVLEGIENCTHQGTPITFIGAKIWCPACNSMGVIGWKGPHHADTMMGKQKALEGDLCLCKCLSALLHLTPTGGTPSSLTGREMQRRQFRRWLADIPAGRTSSTPLPTIQTVRWRACGIACLSAQTSWQVVRRIRAERRNVSPWMPADSYGSK
ncbi:PAAR domain-containing protein [Paraburkholderia pallida]|uniref:PAAR domain-containing protein n=2 Tax=Paraburkholderia pallida TaxID=2547399 RepID=A0A4P7CVI5_9BURK|nr:PAAR domain-containing protein [Paraburkholderia pallida]QBQ98229.1 PAAR domain-containing protein [Paraburkholderia pallida]